MAEIPDIILKNSDQRSLSPKAVAFQVATMAGISLVTVLAFNFLRPNNKIVYEPKVKYHVGDKEPPKISDSLFGWLPPLIHTKEPELLEKVGPDAVTYLRFLKMIRWMFTAISILCCGILIPINIYYNINVSKKPSQNILLLLTIRDVRGVWLWAHVAMTYIITFVVFAFIYVHWNAMVRMRGVWFRSSEYMNSFYARTLMIRGVPKKFQSDEGIRAIFQSMQIPYPTTSVHIGRRVGNLPDLIERHNDTVGELEHVLVAYLKDGKLGRKRPTVRLGGGCGGKKVDAIDYYTKKLQVTEKAVEDCRRQIDDRKPENYGFASMGAVPYAHIVANMLKDKKSKGTDVMLAPNPKDIIWSNLNLSASELAGKKTMGWVYLILVASFNTIPLFILSIFANLSSLTSVVHFLDEWNTASPKTFTYVSGVLPPAVSALFGYLLPHVFRWLSKYQGATTHSRLDRAVIARYYGFLVISQLIIFTLIGVIFISIKNIVEAVGKKSAKDIFNSLNTLPKTINAAYIDQSPYWLTYFPFRGFLAIFDLAQIVNLIWITVKKNLFGRTPREIRDWTQPPEFEYAIYYSNILFMSTVAMVFAPLAPLVAVAGAVVFWVSSWVYKYQLMFVYVSRVETGGRLWNVVINRLLAGIILMQALMCLTIGLQLGFRTFYWVATLPPIVLVLVFKAFIDRRFLDEFKYHIPSQDELAQAKVHSQRSDNNRNRLEKRFGHPALNSELFTPMVHANMAHLLPQVYNGKIESDKTRLGEYGGQKVEARFVQGIRIAAIDQHDLEYDPVLYQRDRGEDNWDNQSISSANLLSERGASPAPTVVGIRQSHLDKYLNIGQPSEYEMSKLGPTESDKLPLLDPNLNVSMYDQRLNVSNPSFLPSPVGTPYMPYNQETPYREAPTHRLGQISRGPSAYTHPDEPARSTTPGYPPMSRRVSDHDGSWGPQQPQFFDPNQQGRGQPSSEQNMAGRGAWRG
ncbi:DUF221-domain-containing protein [Thelephora ganbajun]|uniref:DUF221-domain-containing protein n=1 Tax=Thelephora ganbajun TaxID=370292 RepID=A0ACB6ZNH1_THEGA|nr:DUF221-domain-containing protein [Thelephora ganbajun]